MITILPGPTPGQVVVADREKHRALASALRTARQALPIAELIGQR